MIIWDNCIVMTNMSSSTFFKLKNSGFEFLSRLLFSYDTKIHIYHYWKHWHNKKQILTRLGVWDINSVMGWSKRRNCIKNNTVLFWVLLFSWCLLTVFWNDSSIEEQEGKLVMRMCQSKKRKNDAVLHAKPVEKRPLRGVEKRRWSYISGFAA